MAPSSLDSRENKDAILTPDPEEEVFLDYEDGPIDPVDAEAAAELAAATANLGEQELQIHFDLSLRRSPSDADALPTSASRLASAPSSEAPRSTAARVSERPALASSSVPAPATSSRVPLGLTARVQRDPPSTVAIKYTPPMKQPATRNMDVDGPRKPKPKGKRVFRRDPPQACAPPVVAALEAMRREVKELRRLVFDLKDGDHRVSQLARDVKDNHRHVNQLVLDVEDFRRQLSLVRQGSSLGSHLSERDLQLRSPPFASPTKPTGRTVDIDGVTYAPVHRRSG
jgi:hypothetical protein